MERNNVLSSSIKSIGYDTQSQTLEAEFKRGAVYQYFNFTSEDYGKLMTASLTGSIGSYFSKNIAKKFKCEGAEE